MRWISLGASLLLLDASLTFHNIWPTPAIWWSGAVSVELGLVLLVVALAHRGPFVQSKLGLALLSTTWTALAIGQYAEVTTPALYGRDINLYWDVPFIPDVVAMVTRVASSWLILLCVATAAIALTLLYRLQQLAWRRVLAGISDPRQRWILIVLAAGAVIMYAPTRARAIFPDDSMFPSPVTLTYARQIRLAMRAASVSIGPSPAMDSDLSRVKGADVFLIFIESYGAISHDRPEIAQRLAGSRLDLEEAIRATHRQVASTFVESPTFGGSSWLAHLSLLSGIEVRDPERNAKLMTEQRETLVRAFSRHGYRTVALMPGLRREWPEGAFYGFDDIYGADRLAYRGPEFGWFAIPDQFSLERLDALEVGRPERSPLFVVFPTISTHFPFAPTPPYQPDWRRVSTDAPYDDPAIEHAYERERDLDWVHFDSAYAEAIAYDLSSIAGYLRLRRDRDFVMILIGDHQPPAILSGAHAPWEVPVHVVSSRPQVMQRLIAGGFRAGLTPIHPAIAQMHALLPMFLDAFGDTGAGR